MNVINIVLMLVRLMDDLDSDDITEILLLLNSADYRPADWQLLTKELRSRGFTGPSIEKSLEYLVQLGMVELISFHQFLSPHPKLISILRHYPDRNFNQILALWNNEDFVLEDDH